MKNKINIFEENSSLGGYSIAVRNDWSFKIKRIHISTEDKEAYEKEFGNEIILENRFLEWWTNHKKSQE